MSKENPQLTLDYARNHFRDKPGYKTAQWYLQVAMRYRHSDQIDDERYLDILDELKQWMGRVK